MRLGYHDDALKLIPPDFFDDLEKIEFVNLKILKNGLHYPDIPCGETAFVKVVNDPSVRFVKHEPCPHLLSIAYLFDESRKGLKEVVQSHRGRQAIGHSMTPDPNMTMIEVRQKILRRLEILYMLALNDTSLIHKCSKKDCNICYVKNMIKGKTNYTCPEPMPNIFWLGLIIHCIGDSYSRVHTLREPVEESEQLGGEEGKQYIEKEEINPSFKLVRKVGNLLDDQKVWGEIQKEIKDLPKDSRKRNAYIQRMLKSKLDLTNEESKLLEQNPNNIAHTFRTIYFFKEQKRDIAQLFGGEDKLPSSLNKNNHQSDLKNYPYIISFRYIPHQRKCPKDFHYKYDSQKYTREANLEEYMNKNIKDVYDMYKEHLLDDKTPSQDKITEMVEYLAKNVFPISEGYLDEPSARECTIYPKCQCEIGLDKVYKNFGFEQKEKRKKEQSAGNYTEIYALNKMIYQQLKIAPRNRWSDPLR